jgi:myo-inositol-1(or 4)-monophosphatase
MAEKGKGAYVNNRRLRVSGLREPTEMLVGTGIPHIGKGGHGQFLRELAAVMPRFANVRRLGSAALDIAYVAAGRLDGYWERGLNTWDFAAGSVLIREAGGTFGTLDGKQVTSAKDVICGNEACEQALRAALKTAG